MRPLFDLKDQPEAAALAEVTSHLDAGGDPRAYDNAALRWACYSGHLAVVERLLRLGLTLADARADNNYALRWACRNGHLAVVDQLLRLGLTTVDARADSNYALQYACMYGHLDVLERLIELGLTAADARVNRSEALRWACREGHLAVVERLIELGLTAADARAIDNYALRWACYGGHLTIVERLLSLGLDDVYERLHGTPYDVISHLRRYGYKPTPHILVHCGASRQNADTADWPQRLWSVVEHWEGTPKLEAAESKLTPPQLEAWEAAKDLARPRWLRYED